MANCRAYWTEAT